MSSLLDKLQRLDNEVVRVLEIAECCTDEEIKSLTHIDLYELFPGIKNLKLRKKIFETAQKHETKHELREVNLGGSFSVSSPSYNQGYPDPRISHDERSRKEEPHGGSRKDFLTDTNEPMDTGTSSTYETGTSIADPPSPVHNIAKSRLLSAIHNINKQAASKLKEEGFTTDAAIETLIPQDLNDLFPGHENLKLRKKIFEIIEKHEANWVIIDEAEEVFPEESSAGETASDVPATTENGRNCDQLQSGHDAGYAGKALSCVTLGLESVRDTAVWKAVSKRWSPQEVKYKKIVCAETFGADLQFMKKVEDQLPTGIKLTESKNNHQFTLLFCPITSRVGTDVEAAMTKVTDHKPVILVLMHFSHEPKTTTSVRTWDLDGKYKTIILHVDVFYHMTAHGLLNCQQNDAAVHQTQTELQKFCHEKKENKNKKTAGGGSGKKEKHSTVVSPQRVKYKKIVCAETFGADQQVMKKVKDQLQGAVQLTESKNNHQITLLFCPITSRVGTDVKAAMTKVTDQKPVILVLMHFSHEPKVTTSVRTWDLDAKHQTIILHVDVFYHTPRGLLNCPQNDAAVSQVQNELQQLFPPMSESMSDQDNVKKAKTDGQVGSKSTWDGKKSNRPN